VTDSIHHSIIPVADGVIPSGPVSLDEVVRLFPTLRQSRLASFDDCALLALFDILYSNGWSTHPQARGTIFHRFAAETLRTMQRVKSNTIPIGEALEILLEVCRQRDVPPEEIVRVPLREMKDLRMAAIKFAKDNEFSVDQIVDVERRLAATLAYHDADGVVRERVLTGQLDALLGEGSDGAIVIDWKDTWALPPEPRDAPVADQDDLKGISYHGYFQQRFYGWLVMRNFPAIQRVTLREFYARKTKVRKATLHREQLDDVERELALLVEQFDLAIAQGLPPRPLDFETIGRWRPSPGKHCGFCPKKGDCPIEDEARGVGAIRDVSMAERYAAEMVVAEEIREDRREACKVYVEAVGPIRVRSSKGRRVLGWMETKRGRRFGFFTPDESDRGTHAIDAKLEDAMRDSTARAKEERDRRKRERGKRSRVA
jgi:hypothetical protein